MAVPELEAPMRELLITAAAVAVMAFGVHETAHAPQDQVSYSAKADFIKKCFRDRTKAACEAPPEARLRK